MGHHEDSQQVLKGSSRETGQQHYRDSGSASVPEERECQARGLLSVVGKLAALPDTVFGRGESNHDSEVQPGP